MSDHDYYTPDIFQSLLLVINLLLYNRGTYRVLFSINRKSINMLVSFFVTRSVLPFVWLSEDRIRPPITVIKIPKAMEVFLDQEVHGTPSVIIAHQPLLQALVFTVQTTVATRIGQWVKITSTTLFHPTIDGL